MSEPRANPLDDNVAARWRAVFEAASDAEVADALAVVRFVEERLGEADAYGLEGVDPAAGFASDATIVDWLDGR
jgi:hypothetical protein